MYAGPMHWTHYSLDTFVAPDLSKFTRADLVDRVALADVATHWHGNVVLRCTFISPPSEQFAQYGFAFVRRAAATVRFYELGRLATHDYLTRHRRDAPGLNRYALACDYWEMFIGQGAQAMELIAMVVTGSNKWFEKGVDKEFEQLHGLYLDSKHSPRCLEAGDPASRASFPIWMTNYGLRSKKHAFTWTHTTELVDLLSKVMDSVLAPVLPSTPPEPNAARTPPAEV